MILLAAVSYTRCRTDTSFLKTGDGSAGGVIGGTHLYTDESPITHTLREWLKCMGYGSGYTPNFADQEVPNPMGYGRLWVIGAMG